MNKNIFWSGSWSEEEERRRKKTQTHASFIELKILRQMHNSGSVFVLCELLHACVGCLTSQHLKIGWRLLNVMYWLKTPREHFFFFFSRL